MVPVQLRMPAVLHDVSFAALFAQAATGLIAVVDAVPAACS